MLLPVELWRIILRLKTRAALDAELGRFLVRTVMIRYGQVGQVGTVRPYVNGRHRWSNISDGPHEVPSWFNYCWNGRLRYSVGMDGLDAWYWDD